MRQPAFSSDPTRPIELVTLVLQAAVQGLLKCCDLTWRELAKGPLYDTEDWQGDKCEVSLLEGVPTHFVIARLDDAFTWLAHAHDIPSNWKTALQIRVLFRKTLLQTMSMDPTKNGSDFLRFVFLARDYLQTLEHYPSVEPGPNSPALLAFDPFIGGQLQTATPIRVIPPPSFKETCKALHRLLDGLYEISLLATTEQLSIWDTLGNTRQWIPDPLQRVPYLRSLTQSTFSDGVLILNRYSFGWMINQFFLETVGVSYDSIYAMVSSRWDGGDPELLKNVGRALVKVIAPHIRAHWHNPPRRRRHFMKSLVDWHTLYDTLVQVQENLSLEDVPSGHFLSRLPDIALLWRLSVVREVVLSGFQLELYAEEERAFAYWYTVQVIDTHLKSLDHLVPVVLEESPVHCEMIYQVQFLTALQALCTASFLVSMPLMSSDWDRMRPNFYRRYKWAFRAEYDASDVPVVAQPELHMFIRTCAEIFEGGNPTPADDVELARTILTDLIVSASTGGWAGSWGQDRTQVLQNLVVVCDNLSHLPGSMEEMEAFDATSLKWDCSFHPWFPSLQHFDSSLP
ncbi:hypothetical protein NLJ89_g9616 [Agrocybe chaxingu]|uniref:Uncharacterized protein n=1 Tax=Agrocybe chaxingu TaxID=84603 RepID=A0A9W8JT40_9AGAR|nr:hypothetical protein NLJ89_g9616 [Agrocybe chaxingu]